MQGLRNLLLIMSGILLISSASALSLESDPSTVVDPGKEVSLSITYGECGDGNVTIGVEGPTEQEDINTTFQDWNGTGEYLFTAECEESDLEDNTTITKDSLNVNSLGLEKNELVLGENNRFDLDVESSEGNLTESNIDDINLTTSGELVYETTEFEQEFDIKTNDWDNLAGKDGLNASIKFSNQENSDSTVQTTSFDEVRFSEFRIQLNGYYLDDKEVGFTRFSRDQLDSLEISVSIFDESENGEEVTGLIDEDFKVESETGEGEVEIRDEEGSSNDGKNPYIVAISAKPLMMDEREEFKISLEDDLSSEVNFTVFTGTDFEGHVYDTDDEPIDTTFRMEDPDKLFETDQDGLFVQDFDQIILDDVLEAQFPKATLGFEEKEIGFREKENIYYEFYESPESTGIDLGDDLRAVNLLGLQTNYPTNVDGAELEIDYDTSGIDATEVELYECSDWDFFGENCRNNWEQIEISENQEVWGELTTNDLSTVRDGDQGISSGYVIAVEIERTNLTLEEPVSFSSERLNIDDSLTITGTLIDEEDLTPVENADIEITLYNSESRTDSYTLGDEDTNNTNEEGEFTFEMEEVPEDTGDYIVDFQAEKEDHKSLKKTLDREIEIYKNAELQLEPPSNPEIELGERSTVAYEVENTGQANLENVTLNHENVGERHFTSSNSDIDSLTSGETTSFTVSYILPSDYCETNCEEGETPEIDVVAETEYQGQEIMADASVEIQLTDAQKEEMGLDQDTEETGVNETDTQTGGEESVEYVIWPLDSEIDISGLTSSIDDIELEETEEMAVAMLAVAVLGGGLAVVIRKKQDKNIEGRSELRNYSRTQGIKGKILETSVERGDKSHYFQLTYGNSSKNKDKEEVLHKLKQKVNKTSNKSKIKCESCSEEFDTEAALDIHKAVEHREKQEQKNEKKE